MTGGSALINRLSNFVFVSIPLRFPATYTFRVTKYKCTFKFEQAKIVDYKNHGLVGTRRRKVVRARVYTGCLGSPWAVALNHRTGGRLDEGKLGMERDGALLFLSNWS